MMVLRYLLLVLCCAFFPLSAYADDVLENKILSTDLANNRVEITSGFDGDYLTVFGVHDKPGALAITISGPEKVTIVRRKDKVWGVWMNRRNMSFKDVPAYYRVATTAALNTLASNDLLKRYRIGVHNLVFSPDAAENKKSDELPDFQKALIRNKIAQDLYLNDVIPITHIDKNFFRAQFYIPANAPIGEYKVQTYLINNNSVKAQDARVVKIMQVGTSAVIHNYAHDWSLAYGLLCVCFALLAGWLSSIIRQRIR